MDAQADLRLRWAHTYSVGFVMSRLVDSVFDCRHSQVSKTAFILKFGPPVAKKINFEVSLICINYAYYIYLKQ